MGIAIHRHKQRFGIIATTIVLDKDENCYDQGCNDIRVVIATKWHHYLFHLQQYFSALGTVLPKSFTRAFSSNSYLMFVKFISGICKSVIEIFRNEVFMVKKKKTVKNGQSWCSAVFSRKPSFLKCNFTSLSSFNLFKNVRERLWR